MPHFEFADAKSQCNFEKHGLDFVGAQLLCSDPQLLEIPAKTEGEPRFLSIGLIAGKCWVAVVTDRNDNTRLISVRAQTEEVLLYGKLKTLTKNSTRVMTSPASSTYRGPNACCRLSGA
jgi:uncharacterized protein